MSDYKLDIECTRCGLPRQVYTRNYERQIADDPIKANLCMDCKYVERERQRETYVPLEAILEAVANLKLSLNPLSEKIA